MTSTQPSRSHPGGGPALEMTGLTRSFGAVHAVVGIDLTVAAGEVVALLGPNGAGKSTTVDMLLGLTRPDAGSVRVFGRTPQQAVREGLVGAMLQSGALLPDVTVGQLVSTIAGLQRHPIRSSVALERAGIADLAKRSTNKLSGGQVQRVRYALAIVTDPDLIVLDEPTVAMDVGTRRAFWATMRDYTDEGRTVLFATHYLEEADAYADRVILMRAGRIVADGTAAQIKNQVSGRTVSADLSASVGDIEQRLAALPGVTAVSRQGVRHRLHTTDSDATLRALLSTFDEAHDIEVSGADLEDAFIALTGDDPTDDSGEQAA
jgi:ABC-2 type transport system ATP-binding protein